MSTEMMDRAARTSRRDEAALPALGRHVARGDYGMFLQFGGQSNAYLGELESAWRGFPEARRLLDRLITVLVDELRDSAFVHSGFYSHGIDPRPWFEAPPPDVYLQGSPISQPMLFLAQAANASILFAHGYDADFIVRHTKGIAGHSQGVMPALLLAMGPDDEAFAETAASMARWFLWQGLRMQEAYPVAALPRGLAERAGGKGAPAPMASIEGLERTGLEDALSRFNRGLPEGRRIFIALKNGWNRFVVSGDTPSLVRFQEGLDGQRRRAEKQKEVPFRFAWEYLATSAPFHSPYMHEAKEAFRKDCERLGLRFKAGDLSVPVFSPSDGSDLRDADDLTAELIEMQFTRAVDWPKAIAAASAARGVTHVIDLGAGDAAARLTHACRSGDGVRVLAFSTPDGRDRIFAHDPDLVAPGRAWAAFAPRLCRLPRREGEAEQRLAIDNRYARWAKAWPVFGGGMTPTTAEADIVAAAANAGFVIELAGGGQPTEAMFRARMGELAEKLEPGRGIIVNTMWLDPSLWNLHFPLVLKLKREGFPIIGVTISAGVPEGPRAREILDALNAAGIWCNAFKPGTGRDIEAALAIADENPQHTILLQVEGGKAGGHHSWEDLRGLLLAHYAKIRRRSNVILAAGGGIWNSAIAADWLLGTWHGIADLPPMPVDAVFLGTRLMACRESKASPQVKELLVATRGSDGWVGRGASEGGMTSGTSSLGADLFLVDNAAARLMRRLEAVSRMKDEEIEKLRPELIEALRCTAKPYFGDLVAMTYAEVLNRMAALAAPGGIEEHLPHDGAWYDRSYRERFFDFAVRAEERLGKDGSARLLTSAAQADDPTALIQRLAERCPDLHATRLHPEDADYFLFLCRRSGKPVNFVPAIDRDVRRWFAADALWQSHDRRCSADGVLIVPGPISVQGIERADEPVEEVLQGFVDGCVQRIAERYGTEDAPQAGSLGEERCGIPDGTPPAIASALSSPWMLEGATIAKNPVAGWYRTSREEDLEWERDAHDAIRAVRHRDGWSLALSGEGLEFALDYAVPHGPSACLRYGLSFHPEQALAPIEIEGGERARAIAEFYRAIWQANRGKARSKKPLRVAASAEAIARYAAATGERSAAVLRGGDRGRIVPLNQYFSLCWPTIVSSLMEAAPDADLLQLVHQSNEFRDVRGCAAEGDELEISAGPTDVEETAEGTAVTVSCDVASGGRALLRLVSSFLIRSRGRRDPVAGEKGERKIPPSSSDGEVALSAPRQIMEETLAAPPSALPYACASGDYNPIHVDPHFADLAGFDGPIIHGMWTSAAALSAVVAAAAGGSYARVRNARVEFLSPVAPGAELSCRALAAAHRDGGTCYDLTVADAAGNAAARGRVDIAAPRTAYCFTGQGSQKAGMGMDGYARSAAARRVWDEADAFCCRELGFSILAVVRENPKWLRVGGEDLAHPAGVVNLTQFTQAALVVLAMAHVAELKEAGLHCDDAVFAGHSLGEYAAIASEGFLALEDVVRIVYHRGLTMQRFVPRDEAGRSPYRMIAVRPSAVRLTHDGLLDVVANIARRGGALEVVNFNIRDEQYAVTGDIASLDELKKRLDQRGKEVGASKRSYLELPGIDVPFHSRVLASGVEAFRGTLEASMPAGDGYLRMEGRYVPNLTAEALSLSHEYAARVHALTGSPVLAALLADASTDFRSPAAARALVIELLAYQFASPVQWIQTQELLLGEEGVDRIVEIGPDAVLVNMARRTLVKKGFGAREMEILHVGLDRLKVYDEEPADEMPPSASEADAQAPAATPLPAAIAAPAASLPSAAAIADAPLGILPVLRILLALMTRRAIADVADDRTIEGLAGGNSAKRNEILSEVASEFGAGQIENAQNLSLSELAGRIAEKSRYSAPGAFLRATLERTAKELLPLPVREIGDHLRREWGLGAGRAGAILIHIPALARTGTSIDGGELSPIGLGQKMASRAEALAWIDRCAAEVARFEGIALAKPAAAALGAASADPAALAAFAEERFGAGSHLSNAGREMLRSCGIDPERMVGPADEGEREHREALELYRRELGEAFEAAVRPRFDADRHVLFANAAQWIKRDLAEAFHRECRGEELPPEEWRALQGRIASTPDDPAVREMLAFFARHMEKRAGAARWHALAEAAPEGHLPSCEAHSSFIEDLLRERAGRRWLDTTPAAERETVAAALQSAAAAGFSFRGKRALVTGAGPGSIAEEVVKHLLAAGAEVVVATSRMDEERLLAFRRIYQGHGVPGSALHVLPASQGSRQDIDGLLDWCAARDLLPDLLIPFGAAAEKVPLNLVAAGRSSADLRVMLEGVEALVVGVARRLDQGRSGRSCGCILPLSPNCGVFGGDGVYAESKLALTALIHKRFSEFEHWGRRMRLVGASIGWTRGTSLMRANDRIAEGLTARYGVRTFSNEEMGWVITALCSDAVLEAAEREKTVVAIHGGLDGIADLAGAIREAGASGAAAPQTAETPLSAEMIAGRCRPSWFAFPEACLARPKAFQEDPAGIDDIVVVVGMGEVSPFGSHRTRWEIERDGRPSRCGAAELAWITGLASYEAKEGRVGWVEAESGAAIDDRDIRDRFAAELSRRTGIRPIEREQQGFDPRDLLVFSDVVLDEEMVFPAATEEEARRFAARNHGLADVIRRSDGFAVRLRKGASIKVPKSVALPRFIAGQIPTGWDPVRYGVPRELAASVDRNTLMSLVATAEAFSAAGITPQELTEAVPPARIGNAQGSGLGGMQAHVNLYRAHREDAERKVDALQETLINVMGAWAVQSYVGSAGAMIHPVAACATAAVSLEVGMDLIRSGKADVVVAGGCDDVSEEGVIGFGDMRATADNALMEKRGIVPRAMSRPNDRRRDGFIEAQGGGAMLLARLSTAIELGLPVYAVLAFSATHADGLQASIPAPGLGLAHIAEPEAGRGGKAPLAAALERFGLTADDICAASKHDTSTHLNDANENELHQRIAERLGRTPGNPLLVHSQKSILGHGKGGAAAWQANAAIQILLDAVLPGNPNLEDCDPKMDRFPALTFSDRALPLADPKAVLATSLGFGHVGAALLFLHPRFALERIPEAAWEAYVRRLCERNARAMQRGWEAMTGKRTFFGSPTREIVRS